VRHQSLAPEPEATSLLVAADDTAYFEFDRSATIGRHLANDLVIEHPRVSNRHAALEWDGVRWLLRDLGSRNGTSVDQRRLKTPKRLKEGAQIRFGGASSWIVVRLLPARAGSGYASTEQLPPRGAPDDLHLHLRFTGSDAGEIRVVCGGDAWSATMRQRFVLLYLLGKAGGRWVDDEEIKVGLWGRAGSWEVDRSALHKLIFDLRRLLREPTGGASIIQKARGRTRLVLGPAQIHLEQGPSK
jgi:hypothetical protein